MLIIPAIDLKEGKCVRLYQGREDVVKEYSTNPVEVAIFWENQGARRIHIVDLDGAMRGYPMHKRVILEIREKVKCEIEVGGGIRKEKDAEEYIKNGIDYVILSTVLFEDVSEMRRIVDKFPGKVIISLDLKEKKAGIEGWKREVEFDHSFIIHLLNELPVSGVVLTNIKRDGTLRGVRMEELEQFFISISKPLYIAGGISSYDDLREIKSSAGEKVSGVIIGKALYEGKIEYPVALRIVEE